MDYYDECADELNALGLEYWESLRAEIEATRAEIEAGESGRCGSPTPEETLPHLPLRCGPPTPR